MKFVLMLALVACAVALCCADEDPCRKNCPKNLKRVSGKRSDGSCVTYPNPCLLHFDVLCEKQAFEKCFRGQDCTADETREIACNPPAEKTD